MLAGETACLGAAFIWAFSVGLYRGPIQAHGARTINLAKCLIAAIFFAATVALTAGAGPFRGASSPDLLLIAASGLVGLTLGDSALFASVGALGPYRALLLQTLAPVFTVLMAVAALGESFPAGKWAGMAVTLSGIALVLAPHSGGGGAAGRSLPRWSARGISLGVLGALGQAGGVLLAKAGMATVPFLPASFLRLSAATAGLIVLGVFDGRLKKAAGLARSVPDRRRVLGAAFLGSYIGILLMMAGISLAPAAVAAVLLSTTPVFALAFDVARGKERLTLRAAGGTLLAIAGVALISVV